MQSDLDGLLHQAKQRPRIANR
ncbi:hypothetical protein CLUP02_17190 [Colletotrichum lupini]|uniref:Uncharacterized protein n=1 Tax=Colletotrichum lupini TaxID=145971 RepID=A0A9Q8T9D3_9PEZI|nr:hypothetical protein CLUP02_17190 [Colletotrichum lupini]